MFARPCRRYSGATVTAVTWPCQFVPRPSALPMTYPTQSPPGPSTFWKYSGHCARYCR